jgi:tetratricopeptide (TPR) repeat protein
VTTRSAVFAGACLLLTGCVYYNALYNAERLFEEGEGHRRAGRDSLAAALYADVIRKAAGGYRREPRGAWADDALLLMGRAYLRRGDLREARSTLEEAARLAESDAVRIQALLHLGEAHVMAGDAARGARLLDQALADLPPGGLRAEGHLWRARALLEAGETDAGWWDLEQAAGDRRVRMEASLTRLAWGVVLDDRERAAEGMRRLLGLGEAGARADTVAALAGAAARRWGPRDAAALLEGSDTARWEPSARGRIRLTRASFLRAAGDTAGAEALVRRVAAGFGPAAGDARLELASWQLARAGDLVEARAALPLLLPAVGNPRVASQVDRLQEMISLAERGFTEPLAWFASGEVARDDLNAPALARGLFLAYADAAAGEPWVPKALLAALGVTDDEGDRAWLRGRLEGWLGSPYVLAARGEPALGLEALEEELARRLEPMRTR